MKRTIPWRTIATFAILALGSLQILGHAIGSRTVRGLGLATGIAPYPKVFCEAEGYEPFAAKFEIVGTDATGTEQTIPITPERYSQLAGSYNRRNVYGAALAFAPRLPENLRDHLFSQVLAPGSPLPWELDLPLLENRRIVITPRSGETVPRYAYEIGAGPREQVTKNN